jgi:hypothetical protein
MYFSRRPSPHVGDERTRRFTARCIHCGLEVDREGLCGGAGLCRNGGCLGPRAAGAPDYSFRVDSTPLKLRNDMHSRRSGGTRRQFQGAPVRVLAPQRRRCLVHEARRAVVRVRCDRKVRAGDWQDLCAWSFAQAVRIDKQDNTWVADNRSDGHQVQSRSTRRMGVRQQGRGVALRGAAGHRLDALGLLKRQVSR